MADSAVILVLTLGLLSFGFIYTTLTYVENSPIAELNREMDAGMLSKDTVSAYEKALGLWKTLPIFFLIGMILYFYERGKGTDLPASLFFEYEALLIISVFACMVLVWAYGLLVDTVFGSFYTSTAMNNISSMWERSRIIAICIKCVYIGCLIPGYVGSLLYMIHPVIRQTDNTFFDQPDEEAEAANEDEFVTPYQLQQF
jgi:hypothetical protein